MKQCLKCGKQKPIGEFYRHSQMADGHLGKCKECCKTDNRKNRQQKVGYYRAYDKKRFEDPERKLFVSLHSWYHRVEHPLRYKARTAVSNALRDGRLIRRPCKFCGNPKAEGHHPDYLKLLDVIWLCKACHTIEHKTIQGEKAC